MILKKVARAGVQVHQCNKFTRLLYYCSQIHNDDSTVLRGDEYKETFKVEIVDEPKTSRKIHRTLIYSIPQVTRSQVVYIINWQINTIFTGY